MVQTGDAQKSWCQRLHSAGPLQEQDPDIVCLICAGHLHCGTEAVDPGDGLELTCRSGTEDMVKGSLVYKGPSRTRRETHWQLVACLKNRFVKELTNCRRVVVDWPSCTRTHVQAMDAHKGFMQCKLVMVDY